MKTNNTKKKILIIMPSMFIGGAERSLLGLLEEINYQKYEVSLFLYRHEGEFLEYIPKEVNVLPEMQKYRTFDVPIKSLLFSKRGYFGIKRILSKIEKRRHCHKTGEEAGVWMSMQYTSKALQPLLPNIPGKYDLGIMFLGVADTLLNKVTATKKIAWCHTDYDELGPDQVLDLEVYQRLDGVVAVSDACRDQIVKRYPTVSNKTITIENILPKSILLKQAEETVQDLEKTAGESVLLSIGRFSFAKNFDSVPVICRHLIDKGLKVRWYLIGYGADEALIREKIAENKMEEYVIVLGKKNNPYPYIKACDLYIQPSRYEGKCVTVREAQLLGKPVVITDYATSSDQLQDGWDGIIVPMDNKKCADGIQRLLLDKELQRHLVSNCLSKDYTNQQEINKIYAYLE